MSYVCAIVRSIFIAAGSIFNCAFFVSVAGELPYSKEVVHVCLFTMSSQVSYEFL